MRAPSVRRGGAAAGRRAEKFYFVVADRQLALHSCALVHATLFLQRRALLKQRFLHFGIRHLRTAKNK